VSHPNRDIPIGTLKSIEKQAGIKLRWSPGAKGANSWNISPIFIRTAILITA